MKFDLSCLDITQEITAQLKIQYDNKVEDIINNNKQDTDDGRKITLFHGTSLRYLNAMLLYGLLPRNMTTRSNYEGKIKSNPHLVYLTNKWHYFYANQACLKLVDEGYELGRDWNVPVYVEFKISANESIEIDEDFFHSRYVLNRIKSNLKKRDPILELTVDECLSQYGTVAHIGEIRPEQMVSFTILANPAVFQKNFTSPDSRYMKDLTKWGTGRGKGSLKFIDLVELEDDKYNLTFNMSSFPPNSIIDEFLFDKDKDKYSLKLATVKFEDKKQE